jgi:hypothetical protein
MILLTFLWFLFGLLAVWVHHSHGIAKYDEELNLGFSIFLFIGGLVSFLMVLLYCDDNLIKIKNPWRKK